MRALLFSFHFLNYCRPVELSGLMACGSLKRIGGHRSLSVPASKRTVAGAIVGDVAQRREIPGLSVRENMTNLWQLWSTPFPFGQKKAP